MPDSSQYADGFSIEKNMTINSYNLTNLSIGHDQIKRWNEYSYPIKMTWSWISWGSPQPEDMNRFFAAFTRYVGGVRIIRSDSGRPYKCVFQWPLNVAPKAYYSDDYKTIDLEYNGHAKRVSEAEAHRIETYQQEWKIGRAHV